MRAAVIYARYSSESQSEQSIEGQLRVCQKYAKDNGMLIVDTYIDRAMTGTNDMRPSFQKMIRDSYKRQWQTVLVYKLDRFSRNKYESTIHKKTLKDNGVKIVSAMENIPDTPEGIILESLLEGMNAYYSAELSQKVRRGLKESWIKGYFTGGTVPFGYGVANHKYVLSETEAPVVLEIFSKYAQGYTAVAIANELKAKGIRNRKGNYIDDKFIFRIIANGKYTGRVKYGGQVYDNIIPPIINQELWLAVQQIRESNRHAPGKKKDIFDFILSGKLICGECKRLMVGESGTSHTKAKHYYYSCLSRRRKKLPCSLKSAGKQFLEDLVINTTWKLLSDDNAVHTVAAEICRLHAAERNENLTLKDLQAKRTSALKASDNLIAAIEQGIITEQTKNRLKELETLINGLDFDIEREKQREYSYLTVDMIVSYLHGIIGGNIDDVETRKAIVKTFIREVILYPDKIIITYNFCDLHDVYKIDKENITEIETLSQYASSFPVSSYMLASSAPEKT